MGKDEKTIEEYLKKGAEELGNTIGKMTQGSKGDRIKQGLQELISKDTAVKAGIAGAAGAAVAIPIPIIGPVTGFFAGAGVYAYLRFRGAYNRATTSKYSKI